MITGITLVGLFLLYFDCTVGNIDLEPVSSGALVNFLYFVAQQNEAVASAVKACAVKASAEEGNSLVRKSSSVGKVSAEAKASAEGNASASVDVNSVNSEEKALAETSVGDASVVRTSRISKTSKDSAVVSEDSVASEGSEAGVLLTQMPRLIPLGSVFWATLKPRQGLRLHDSALIPSLSPSPTSWGCLWQRPVAEPAHPDLTQSPGLTQKLWLLQLGALAAPRALLSLVK